MYIFTESEIRQSVQLNQETIAAVEEGFVALGENRVQTPPIMRVDFTDVQGEVDVKTAAIAGQEQFAIKVSSGFFQNNQLGLPTASGLMMLFSTKTGFPEAVLLDNGYLTEVRTAAAGALAAKYLAPGHVDTAGVIGVGGQARQQIIALQQVRQFNRLLVYGRSEEKVSAYIEEMTGVLGVPVRAAESTEDVVRHSDVVVTTTPSTTPIIEGEWLHPGLHITAMGSDAQHKQELDSQVLVRANRFVCDLIQQSQVLGELRHALQDGTLQEPESVLELGKIAAGFSAGRQSDSEITVCDLTGTGVQDTAIASLAFRKLREVGVGLEI